MDALIGSSVEAIVCCFLVVQMGGSFGAIFVITGALILLVFDNGL
jgi:hypothetical protein